uniref:Protein ZGRF1-like n=1 Tax=Phallusia mammillata TaxID=59560 RepID=A0A6F9DYJ8_9ASCI|nr:protein ZGRF1-like [Phallusia mammillata]
MKRKFKVLYTHQKTKKQKVWQDGWLTLSLDAKRGFLCTEDKRQISTVYLEKKEVESGVDLESDRYLIQVEEEISQGDITCNSSQSSQPSTPKRSQFPKVAAAKPVSKSVLATPPNDAAFKSSQPLKKKFNIPRRTLPKQPVVPVVQEKEMDTVQDLSQNETGVSIWSEIKPKNSVPQSQNRMNSTALGTVPDSTPTYRGTQDLLNLLSGSAISEQKTEEKIPQGNQQDSSSAPSFEYARKQHLFNRSYNSEHLSTDKLISIPDSIQVRIRKEIFFPSAADLEVSHGFIPTSTASVPVSYESVDEYVQIWTGIINEAINIILWRKSSEYHKLMRNADISTLVLKQPELKYFECGKSYEKENVSFVLPEISGTKKLTDDEVADMDPPYCEHEAPCKVARVRKEGPNTGRLFYACRKGKRRCKFFQWVDEAVLKQKGKTEQECPPAEENIVKINNTRALTSYLNRNKVNLFVGCQIERKSVGKPTEEKNKKIQDELMEGKRQTILKLSRMDQSLASTKGGVWILSCSLELNSNDSILIRVLSNSQSAAGELIIQPIRGSIPIEWQNGVDIHALFLTNPLPEFTYLQSMQRLSSLPILPQLLRDNNPKQPGTKIKQVSHKPTSTFNVKLDEALKVVTGFVEKFNLNEDQASILCSAAEMLLDKNNSISPLLVIDGVVGSGKTFLLAIVALLVFELLSTNENEADDESGEVIGRKRKIQRKWKILITSELDSVVDQIILKLVQVGFSNVVRVGDLNKINRKLLPHSVNIRGGSDEHVKKLKLMLRQGAESDPERHYIRKSLEMALSGGAKRLLHNAFVVGVTCPDALAPSIGYYKFPVIIMDDASMISEPMALSTLTRFSCEKLLIAGDFRISLINNSAIQRSLFQRLLDSGNDVFHLNTHYRCHPHVVALLNHVIYDDTIIKTSSNLKSLVPSLPGVCFCDVIGKEENSSVGFINPDQAKFCADIAKLLLSHGVPGTSVAVMTTHDEQVSAITSAMQNIEFYDLSDVNCIKVGTLPTFAAAEFDVVIISCVQNSASVNDHSTNDVIRMLTRARSHVIVVASLRHLATNPLWSNALKFCKKQNNQVTSTFLFRKLFQKKINSAANLCDEVPLIAEQTDVVKHVFVTSESSEDDDAEEEFFSQLKRKPIAQLSESDDDLPVLRHKRPKLNNDVTKNVTESLYDNNITDSVIDNVTEDSHTVVGNDPRSQHELNDLTVKDSQEHDDVMTDVLSQKRYDAMDYGITNDKKCDDIKDNYITNYQKSDDMLVNDVTNDQNLDVLMNNDVNNGNNQNDDMVHDVINDQNSGDGVISNNVPNQQNSGDAMTNDVTHQQNLVQGVVSDDDMGNHLVSNDVTDVGVKPTQKSKYLAEFNAGSIFTITDCDLTLDSDDIISPFSNSDVKKLQGDVAGVDDNNLLIAMPEVLQST